MKKIQPQQMITRDQFKKELTDGKLKVILNIIGYCMLLLGSIGVYIALFMNKITIGKINISDKNFKKISAFVLVIIWFLFLIAESLKLHDIINV